MEQRQDQPQDDEFEQLLDEIPRATSAPPHLEELQRAYGASLDDSPFVLVREDEVAVKPFADIRLDEDYEEFYKIYSGVKKLPPPMENRQLYTESPKAIGNQLSPFFMGLGLDSSSPRHSFFNRHHHQEQQQEQQQFLEEVERQVQKQRQQQQQQQQQQQKQQQQQQAQQQQQQQQKQQQQQQQKQKQQQDQQRLDQRLDGDGLSSAFGSMDFGDTSSGVRKGSSPGRGEDDRSRRGNHGRRTSLDSSMEGSNGQGMRGNLANGDAGRLMNSEVGGMDHYSYGGGNQGNLENILAMRGGVGPTSGLGMFGKWPQGLETLGGGLGRLGFDGAGGPSTGLDNNAMPVGGLSPAALGPNGVQFYEQLLRNRGAGGLDLYGMGGAGLGVGNMGNGGPRGVGLDALGLPNGAPLDAYSAAAMQAARMFPAGVPAGLDLFSAAAIQQPMSLDYDMATLLQMQQVQRAQQMIALQAQAQRLQAQMEDERLRQQRQQLQQQLILQQQQMDNLQNMQPQQNPWMLFSPQSQSPHAMTRQVSANAAVAPPQSQQGKPVRSRSANLEDNWKGGVGGLAPGGDNRGGPQGGAGPGGICRYFMQGYCSRGNSCPFLHGPPPLGGFQGGDRATAGGIDRRENEQRTMSGGREKEERRLGTSYPPERILPSRGRSSPGNGSGGNSGNSGSPPAPSQRRKGGDYPINALANNYPNGQNTIGGGFIKEPGRAGNVDFEAVGRGTGNHISTNGGSPLDPMSGGNVMVPSQSQFSASHQQAKYSTLEEVEGRIYTIAKDQHGCRFLQRKFDEGGTEDVAKIFSEIIGHIIELMTDPFGNYLVQKLLEVCTEGQRMEMLHRVTANGDLVTISLNMHGTRAVQKLIETLQGPDQVALVIGALRPGVVALINDLNGNHVVQRCLQRLSNQDSQFIFDAAASHCVEIATHRHGCCVLQRCVDFASGVQRDRLVSEIAANALVLSQDPFGNYVVQYILDLNLPWATVEVMVRLEGNYPFLAQQKFSSNVVEKCLKLAGEEHKGRIVRELTVTPRLGQLLQDPFANYVVQSALTVSKGSLHSSLVEAIRPHLQTLRSSPYGKRILSRTNLKK